MFLCFGKEACKVIESDVQNTLIAQDLVVYRKHPRVKKLFLSGRNVFEEANSKLAAAGRGGVSFLGG